jgi:hypothetical protein
VKADVGATDERDPSRWASPRTADVLVALTVALMVASIPLSLPVHQLTAGVAPPLVMSPFAAVGWIVARRQPRNAIGWIMLLLALIYIASGDAGFYAVLAYRFGHPHLPLARLAVFLTQGWTALLVLLPLPILLFPDGRLPSPRWRWAVRAYLVEAAVFLAGEGVRDFAAFTDRRVQVDSSGELAVFTQAAHGTLAVLAPVLLVTYAALALSFVVGQLLTFRRSTGQRRAQLKWLMSGGVIGIVGFILLLIFSTSSSAALRVVGTIGICGVIAIPLSIGVGILKYRLYDIDRLISRTLSYAVVTGLLVGVYIGIVTLTTRELPLSSPVGVAASTLTVAALFTPLRRRAQRLVDHRFNRARYDAEATVAAFSARLRDEVDLNRVQLDLLDVVRRSVEPSQVAIWIPREDPVAS